MTNEQIIKATEELIGKISGPAKQLNQLVVNHIEQLSRIQLKAAESYTDLGLGQIKASLAIGDAKGLQEFVQSQGKVAQNLSQKFTTDSEALARLNQEFAASVQKLAQDSAQALAPKAGKVA